MPWKECHVMDERLRFVARLLEGETMAALCEEFGISRKTGYKIFERYKTCGVDGADRSQPPAVSPRESAADGRREDDRRGSSGNIPSWGAPKIRERLRQRWPEVHCPAISTVHAVLDRHGLVTAGAAAPARADGHAALPADRRPMRLWCADYKGEFMLGNRRYCYPLTITDFASRYLLACEALSTTQGALRVHRLRARVSGIRPARGHPHGQRRALCLGARALRVEQARRVVAAPRHRPRAHRARAIPSRTAGTSACT